MRISGIFLLLATALSLCARPYSNRVKIADETRVQARDEGIPYERMLDAALDGKPAHLQEFILLWKKLDTSGAYFHFFHIYEAAEIAGDQKLAQALKGLAADEQKTLAQGLREAGGWLKRKQKFAARFPQATQQFKTSGIQVDF